MTRNHRFSVDEFYHICNRGVEKRQIFLEYQDKERFLKLLYLSNSEKPYVLREVSAASVFDVDRSTPLVAVCAYSLMDNHFHLLLRELSDGGISKFMLKLATAYAMYFNIKYSHSGALFQGPFRSKHLNEDEYLRHVLTYIHMNHIDMIEPNWKNEGVKNKNAVLKSLRNYKYQSLPDYLGITRAEGAILNREHFPAYYASEVELLADIKNWIDIVPELDKTLF